jgi:hypothetical protein
MESFLKEYIQDFIDDFLWFIINPSYKNLRNAARYFSISYYKRYKLELTYWKDKDVRKSHADDF